jgi:hypothetical protein
MVLTPAAVAPSWLNSTIKEAKMTELPEPLTPPDCDLRHYDWMPLTITVLKGSRAWLRCKRNPALAFYFINLWTAAWHQVPAASLEDDDEYLCDLAQCDEETWSKLKNIIMSGFVKCSDGRLYHQYVAREANKSWQLYLAQRSRTEAATAARRAKQTNVTSSSSSPSAPPSTNVTSNVTNNVTSNVTKDVTDNVTEDVTIDATFFTSEPLRSPHTRPTRPTRPTNLKKERSSLRSPRAHESEPAFERFWEVYPRKVGKGAARKAWLAAIAKAPEGEITAAVTRQKFDHRERFIPHPATWLNQERWLDEEGTFDPVLRAAGLRESDYSESTPDWLKLPGGSA